MIYVYEDDLHFLNEQLMNQQYGIKLYPTLRFLIYTTHEVDYNIKNIPMKRYVTWKRKKITNNCYIDPNTDNKANEETN
jgi:hypothetical protein